MPNQSLHRPRHSRATVCSVSYQAKHFLQWSTYQHQQNSQHCHNLLTPPGNTSKGHNSWLIGRGEGYFSLKTGKHCVELRIVEAHHTSEEILMVREGGYGMLPTTWEEHESETPM